MWRAIVRPPSAALGDCQLTFVERRAIDIERAVSQHRGYVRVLASLGFEVEELAASAELADATFVEDPAVVVDELAIIARPVASRRAEVATIATALERWRPLVTVEAPATLEGGDVLVVDRQVFVGRTQRTNAAGIDQLAARLAPHGYRVQGVDITGCLHLKSAVSHLGNAFLVNPAWIDAGLFGEPIEVDPSEPFAANALASRGVVLMSASAPRTIERVRARGFEVIAVSIDEIEKAEGGLSCMSLRFRG